MTMPAVKLSKWITSTTWTSRPRMYSEIGLWSPSMRNALWPRVGIASTTHPTRPTFWWAAWYIVWKTFKKLCATNAKCNLCEREVPTISGDMSGMLTHMRNVHPNVMTTEEAGCIWHQAAVSLCWPAAGSNFWFDCWHAGRRASCAPGCGRPLCDKRIRSVPRHSSGNIHGACYSRRRKLYLSTQNVSNTEQMNTFHQCVSLCDISNNVSSWIIYHTPYTNTAVAYDFNLF